MPRSTHAQARPRTARLLAATTAAAVAVVALPYAVGPASAQAPVTVTTTPVTIQVFDGPEGDIQIAIDADLYLPSTVSEANPAPAIIMANGFGGSKSEFGTAGTFFAKQGYVVLAYSSRGFGATTGEIGLDSPDYDVKDVEGIVKWLADRDEVIQDGVDDPRVGMYGPSYGGGIQLMASEFIPAIDAIVPRITWNSLVYALSPDNDNPSLRTASDQLGVFKQVWTSLFFALGTAQPASSPPGNSTTPSECLGFISGLCEAYYSSVALGRPTDATLGILAHSSPETRADRLRTPTLLIQGEADTLFNLNDAIANYTAIDANHAPVKMIWFDGGHGHPTRPGQESFTAPDVINDRVLAWYDRYLRGNLASDTGPGFEYFRNWVPYTGSAEPAFGSAPAYPPATTPATFALSANGTLQAEAFRATPGALDIIAPAEGLPASHTETSNFQNTEPFSGIAPSDPPGQSQSWTSAPLSANTDVVGTPRVTFRIASPTGEATVFGKLFDVAPDGSATLIRNLVAPARTGNGAVTLTLPAIVHRFEQGHRVRFTLASTDDMYRAAVTPSVYTITLSPTGSLLTLPTVAAAPDPDPVVPETPTTVVLPLFALALGLAVVARRRKLA